MSAITSPSTYSLIFASASGTSLNYAQLRDAYFDLSIDKEKQNRFRVGQSKIPYGFEELQSSQNRLDFDRTDALNSLLRTSAISASSTIGRGLLYELASTS